MTGPHEYALMPLGARPRFPVKDPALAVAWRVRDQAWPVIVTSRRSAGARNAMTRDGSASCITLSPAAAELALTCVPAPRRILDVGCGTGYRRENCCGGQWELGLQRPHRPRSVLKHAQVSPAAHATSPIGSVLLAAALEGSLTLEEDMALLAAMAGHLRGSVDGVGGHERGERVRTTGVGSAGIGIVRALSAMTADVLRDLVEELAGAAG